MNRFAALLPCALLACCGPARTDPVAAYRAPDVPAECRAAVYQDPAVRKLRIASAGVPLLAAENQDDLAFAEAEAERKCLRDKGVVRGGVEPVRHLWYPVPVLAPTMLPPLRTIGYEGSTVPAVIDALRAAGVAALVDVRAVAASRKPGFSKRVLAASLAEHGISYLHLRGLGTPKEGRQAVRAGHPERMRAIFAGHMRGDGAQAELACAAAEARRAPVCLLCFEREHEDCHRAVVARLIAERTGQPVEHLRAPPGVADALGGGWPRQLS